MPETASIPAPIEYINVFAVKKSQMAFWWEQSVRHFIGVLALYPTTLGESMLGINFSGRESPSFAVKN